MPLSSMLGWALVKPLSFSHFWAYKESLTQTSVNDANKTHGVHHVSCDDVLFCGLWDPYLGWGVMGCVFLGRVLSHSNIVEKELPKSFLPQPSSPSLLWPRIQHLLYGPVLQPQLSWVAVGDSHSHETVPTCLGNHNLFCLHGSMKRWFPVGGKLILYQYQLHQMDIANYNEPNGSWLGYW